MKLSNLTFIVFALLICCTGFAQNADKFFLRLDTDKDDKVSKQEFLDSWRKHFAKIDTDSDEHLNFDEWQFIGGSLGEAKYRSMFERSDKNGDQKISQAEYDTFRTRSFDPTDKNGDGFWDLSENASRKGNGKVDKTEIPPTAKDVKYGSDDSQLINLWKVESEKPLGLLLHIHGGGWMGGKKRETDKPQELKRGFHLASISYPLVNDGARQPAMLNSALRAVQFLRYKAEEWNIDPSRIVVTGGSAGGCSSLLVALHDDVADPDSDDPVKRFSSRVSGAVVAGAQTTMIPFVIKERIGEKTFGNPMPYKPFGAETAQELMDNWDQYKELVLKCSPLTHLSKDDPPLHLFYNVNREFPTTKSSNGIHSPIFGEIMLEACKKVGVECHLEYWEKDKPKPAVSRQQFLERLLLAPASESQNTQATEKCGNTLIWVSTTIVPKNEPSRFVGDEIKYNKIAEEVMDKEGVIINDLHELTKGFTQESFVKPGDVHYTTAASALLGKKVARSIVAALPGTTLPDATTKPNIILFLVDDMGLMDTSVPMLVDEQGQPRQHALNQWYRTPNMERLAKQGIRFSQFYAQSVCSPTRVSIMTGQNSARHRVTQFISPENRNPGPEGWRWEGLTHEDVTLPAVLRRSGYHTIFAGKAHFAPKGHEGEDPANLGFDVNIAGCSYGQPGSYYGEDGYGNLNPKREFRGIPGLEKYHKTNTFLSEAITLEAKAAIDHSLEQDRPFFLYMSHYAVHSPFQSDPRFADNYTKPKKAKAAQAYATLVEGMDKSLGDLMDHVTNKGLGENTLILFVGDNGSDAPTATVYGHHSSAPLRGKKATCYEGGMRVPFIAGWAQGGEGNAFPIAKGAIHTSQIGTVMDLYSTILETAGADNPTGHVVDGVSLLTQFAGKENPGRPDHFMCHFPHIHRSSYFTSLRKGNWKLIYRYRTEPFKRKQEKSLPRYELYDLSTDPYENHNLAGEKSQQLHKMMKTLVSRLEAENAQYPVNNKGEELRPMMP